MSIKWCDRSLLISPVYYTLIKSQKDFDKVCRKLGVKPFNWLKTEHSNATTHFFTKDDKVTAVVCIDTNSGSPNQIRSLIVHEAVHIKQEICALLGETHPSREFEAYMLQSITDELFNLCP